MNRNKMLTSIGLYNEFMYNKFKYYEFDSGAHKNKLYLVPNYIEREVGERSFSKMIYDEDFISIYGEYGSGKTTLLKYLMALFCDNESISPHQELWNKRPISIFIDGSLPYTDSVKTLDDLIETYIIHYQIEIRDKWLSDCEYLLHSIKDESFMKVLLIDNYQLINNKDMDSIIKEALDRDFKVIVTTSERDTKSDQYSLTGYNREQIESYIFNIRKIFNIVDYIFIDHIMRYNKFINIMRNPYLLRQICEIYIGNCNSELKIKLKEKLNMDSSREKHFIKVIDKGL